MHAAVLLEAGGRAIYIDPAQGNFEGLPKADLIIITDIHGDHLVPQMIEKLKKPSTQIFAPESVAKTVTAAQVMRYGDTKRWESWTIEAVAAYNIKHGPAAGQVFHDNGRGNGYVLTYGGKRFYISGDTEGTPEMGALKNIDVALVCMNLPYTMSPEEAVDAVKSFRPKVVIPYHYRGSDLSALKNGLAGTGIEVRLLEWYPEGQGGGPPDGPGGRGGPGAPGGRGAAPGAPNAPAQQNNQGGRGGMAAAPGPPSPEILPDQRTVFRFVAPKASEVTLTADFWLQESRVEQMKKDEQGVWTFTSPPLYPGFYSYYFTVDGVQAADPKNIWVKAGVRTLRSVFEVPGAQDDWEAVRNVPHGDVRVIWYHSSSVGNERRMHVYVPPGYDSSRERYPVLYLLHGGDDRDDGWTQIGRAGFILDNLIAQGKAKPMIVAMPYVYAVEPNSPEYPNNSAMFAKDFVSDLMPYVEKNYRVLATPENRALGGLSLPNIMTDLAFANMDKFNFIGFTGNGLSNDRIAAYEKQFPGVLEDPANVKRIKIWIGDGVNARTYAGSRNLAENMKKRGYDATFSMSRGIHEWPWFRHEFYEMAQVLFR